VEQLAVRVRRATSNAMPGERWSWETTTRSAPLMMKEPRSVTIGISPM
jgi:hypothetical protein